MFLMSTIASPPSCLPNWSALPARARPIRVSGQRRVNGVGSTRSEVHKILNRYGRRIRVGRYGLIGRKFRWALAPSKISQNHHLLSAGCRCLVLHSFQLDVGCVVQMFPNLPHLSGRGLVQIFTQRESNKKYGHASAATDDDR